MTNTSSERQPSRFAANVYLIIGIAALILSGGSDNTLIHYLVGSAVEIGLVLLMIPFLRIENVTPRPALRIKRPDRTTVLLALGWIPALWLSGVLLNLIAVVVFGYTTPVPPWTYPSTLPEALLLILTTTVVAPICEELIFRGYILSAYENRRVWIGILVTSLIFALYHLRLQGVFALIPISIGLGVVAWRTGSVFPSMVMHAAYNGIATIIMVAVSFFPMRSAGAATGLVVCLGALTAPFSLLAFWALWRKTEPRPPETFRAQTGWKRWAWVVPLVGLMIVYGYGAFSEYAIGRFPQRFIEDEIELRAPDAWSRPLEYRYEVQNLTGDALGDATCVRSPAGMGYALACEAEFEGYDLLKDLPGFAQVEAPDMLESLPLPSGMPSLNTLLRGDAGRWTLNATWASEMPSLQSLTGTQTVEGETVTATLTTEGGPTLSVRGIEDRQIALQPEGMLVFENEWPWRLEGLPFQMNYGGEVTLIAVADDGTPVSHRAHLNVRGGEPTWTAQGTVIAWRITITYEDPEEKVLAAWYETDPPHRLVRFDDGQRIYVLQSVEPTRESQTDDLLH